MEKNNIENARNITARDIAREAGVSVATVSRILNQSGPVKESTRRRVQEVIDKYGFRPNALARSLYNKKSKTIGFMIPDITNMFFAQLCLEVEKAALDHGYSVFLCNSINNNQLESRYLEILREKQVDGIILAGGRINQTKTNPAYVREMESLLSGIPLVMINGDMQGLKCYKIRSDEYHAVDTMVDYLLSLGHTRIGLLGGYTGITSFDLKREALEKAREGLQFTLKPEWIIETPYTIDGGIVGMEQMLQLEDRPTALIAINDLVAIGAIKSCRMHDVQVPEDLSVIGFDDIELARSAIPALTTMAHPYQEMGRLAVKIIHDQMEGQEPQDDIWLETKLIIRDSCRPFA